MKLLNLSIQGLDLFQDGLVIDFLARQRVTENNNDTLSHLFGSIYKQDIIGIVGINASGKTTALKWVSFILDIYLAEGKVDSKEYKTLLQNQEIEIEALFTSEKNLIKIYSRIAPDEQGNHYFTEEKLWKKKIVNSITRENIDKFTDRHLEIVRSETDDSLFLSDYMSIMISQKKKQTIHPRIVDLLQDTNFNLMRVLGDVPTEIIQFLDNSVEYVSYVENAKEKMRIRLKFKGQSREINMYDPVELATYLSSGTIKGLNVFAGIKNVLATGGFLIIDEIENHFNQAIIRVILQLFKHEQINVTGASLIFTTHYSDLLDEFERNDSIYISFKEDTLRLKNLNDLLKRNDYKKSEVYQSSYVGKTAPSYDAYMALKKYFLRQGKDVQELMEKVKNYE